jgi:hypothetical protein
MEGNLGFDAGSMLQLEHETKAGTLAAALAAVLDASR